MKKGRVVIGRHVTAGQQYLARWAGVSGQNDLPTLCIEPWLCVVQACFTTLQVFQASGRLPCARVVGPIYLALHREGVREQGLCFHDLALLSGEGLTKHTSIGEGVWMLGTECAPGLGKGTPRQLLGVGVSACVDEQQGQGIARCEGVAVPVTMQALLYRQRVTQQRLGLVVLLLILQDHREYSGCTQGFFVLGAIWPAASSAGCRGKQPRPRCSCPGS